jgi:hypothetical protein
MEFLNGLRIPDEDLPLSASSDPFMKGGSVVFNANKMGLNYDPRKWKQIPSDEVGRFTFRHLAGDGYAAVMAERGSVPMESLPDAALSSLQSDDPNAAIVFKRKRNVNGADVWFLKMEAEVKKIPLVYWGYLYSGKGGTVRVFTFTAPNLVDEYDKDFMNFLNGLWVSE